MFSNENHSACSKCEGKCCKQYPGSCFPEDFDNDEVKVRKAIESGRYAIDWWEDSPPIYFVRPAIKGFEGRVFHPTWGDQCTFLTIRGCELRFDDRPSVCKLLIPELETEEGCQCRFEDFEDGPDAKKHSANLWRDSGIDLEKLGDEIEEKKCS